LNGAAPDFPPPFFPLFFFSPPPLPRLWTSSRVLPPVGKAAFPFFFLLWQEKCLSPLFPAPPLSRGVEMKPAGLPALPSSMGKSGKPPQYQRGFSSSAFFLPPCSSKRGTPSSLASSLNGDRLAGGLPPPLLYPPFFLPGRKRTIFLSPSNFL